MTRRHGLLRHGRRDCREHERERRRRSKKTAHVILHPLTNGTPTCKTVAGDAAAGSKRAQSCRGAGLTAAGVPEDEVARAGPPRRTAIDHLVTLDYVMITYNNVM